MAMSVGSGRGRGQLHSGDQHDSARGHHARAADHLPDHGSRDPGHEEGRDSEGGEHSHADQAGEHHHLGGCSAGRSTGMPRAMPDKQVFFQRIVAEARKVPQPEFHIRGDKERALGSRRPGHLQPATRWHREGRLHHRTAAPASSPAASASASPSAAPSCATRSPSSSTSRSPTSTPSSASRCAPSSPRLHARLGTTMVYVTHDQVEAMTLADRIVVLRAGPHRAGRHPPRPLQPPRQPLRRRLHRRPGDELPPRRPPRRRTAGRGDRRHPPPAPPPRRPRRPRHRRRGPPRRGPRHRDRRPRHHPGGRAPARGAARPGARSLPAPRSRWRPGRRTCTISTRTETGFAAQRGED